LKAAVKAAKAKRSAAAQKAEAIEIVIDGHGYRVTGTDIAGRSDRPYHAALIALEKAGYGLGELIIVRPRLRTTDKHEMTLGQRLELWRTNPYRGAIGGDPVEPARAGVAAGAGVRRRTAVNGSPRLRAGRPGLSGLGQGPRGGRSGKSPLAGSRRNREI
jgi:hypothetical protein